MIIFERDEERGQAIAKELGGAVFWPGVTDVASEDSVLSSIKKGVEKLGTISGVVNCAGIGMVQKVTFGCLEQQVAASSVDNWNVGLLTRIGLRV